MKPSVCMSWPSYNRGLKEPADTAAPWIIFAEVQRFGRVFSIWVAVLMLLNMGIAMTAEYTAVGDLFELVIGTNRVPIVVIIGVVSMLYTAYGGLYVSIITDQWQVSLCSQALVIMVNSCSYLTRSMKLPQGESFPERCLPTGAWTASLEFAAAMAGWSCLQGSCCDK